MNYFVESRWGCRIHADDADSFIALTFRFQRSKQLFFGIFRALSIAFFSNNLSSFVYCTYCLGIIKICTVVSKYYIIEKKFNPTQKWINFNMY